MTASAHDTPTINATDRMGKRARLIAVIDRDGPACVYCGCAFEAPLAVPTTEHLVPRLKGGPSWFENEVAACKSCNQARGHQSLGAWLEACLDQGWPVQVTDILCQLNDLSRAIERRGGQRRARRYIASQRRRLLRLADSQP